jgi:hypothetical protein
MNKTGLINLANYGGQMNVWTTEFLNLLESNGHKNKAKEVRAALEIINEVTQELDMEVAQQREPLHIRASDLTSPSFCKEVIEILGVRAMQQPENDNIVEFVRK